MKYVCEVCGTQHSSEDKAKACEESHKMRANKIHEIAELHDKIKALMQEWSNETGNGCYLPSIMIYPETR